VTDGVLRTRFATDKGELSFQEYFVRERLKPVLRGIKFAFTEPVRRTHEVSDVLAGAELVIIGPSNPLISIDPILQVVRDAMPRERTVAVTPIVAGVALKGPTVEMMRALGVKPDPVEVARMYSDIATTFVLDERDQRLTGAIEGLGYRVLLCDTVMRDGGRTLARAVLSRLGDV